MKQLVMDARMFSASGIGRYIQELLVRLRDYDLLCIIHSADKEFFSREGIPYIILDIPIYSIKEQIILPKIIPPCEVFWSPHFNIPIFPIKAKKRLVTIHDVFHLANAQMLSKKQQLYAKLVYRMAVRKADQVITVSNFSKSEILKYVGKSFDKKIAVILNGASIFSKSETSQKYAPKGRYFLYVGNIKPHKNLRSALMAFRDFLVNEKESSAYFVLVGKREGFLNGEEGISVLLDENTVLKERVIFTEYVEDEELYSLYQDACSVVFPSLYEGFGLPPLEAMQAHTPSIVSNAASMPEICGDAVLYFDPTSVSSIEKAMLTIWRDQTLRKALVEKGSKHVQQFNWESSFEKHKIILNKLFETRYN